MESRDGTPPRRCGTGRGGARSFVPVARFLDDETNHIHAYVNELREHNPFRS